MQMRLHERYGPIVRVGPERLSYIDSNAWKDIQGHRADGHGSFEKEYEIQSPHDWRTREGIQVHHIQIPVYH